VTVLITIKFLNTMACTHSAQILWCQWHYFLSYKYKYVNEGDWWISTHANPISTRHATYCKRVSRTVHL